MADLEGRTLGKYRIMERLGQGGMAEVYKAYHPGLERHVAIKILHGYLADAENFVGRFQREARSVAVLRHPNIVQVFDFDFENDLYYMVMEFIDGRTLKDRLQDPNARNEIALQTETVRIFKALGSAVDYAHSRGVIHRDIKPANIMFDHEGNVYLTDFGIAYIVGASRFTVTGLTGTPTYMAPEQSLGAGGDERSDIYSLGVILYEILTGQVPFDAPTPIGIIMKHVNEPLPRPSLICPDIPTAVERVVMKALSKEPAERYATASMLAQALEIAYVTGDETLVDRVTPDRHGPRAGRSKKEGGRPDRTEVRAQPPAPRRPGDWPTLVGPSKWPSWLPLLAGVAILVCVVALIALFVVYPRTAHAPTVAVGTAAPIALDADDLTPGAADTHPETVTAPSTAAPETSTPTTPSPALAMIATPVRPPASEISAPTQPSSPAAASATPETSGAADMPDAAPTGVDTSASAPGAAGTSASTLVAAGAPAAAPTTTAAGLAKPTAAPAPSDTASSTGTPTLAPAATATPAPTETATPAPSLTNTATGTPMPTETSAATNTSTATPTETATATDTSTATPTAGPTITPDVAATATTLANSVAAAVAATLTAQPHPTDTGTVAATGTSTLAASATRTSKPTHAPLIVPTSTQAAQPGPSATGLRASPAPLVQSTNRAPSTTLSPNPTPSGTPASPTHAPTASPTAKGPVASALVGHLAFVVFKPGMSKATYDLYVSKVDGSERRRLWEWARQPNFRRSDGRLAFAGDGQGKDNLWSINLDGSDAREVSLHPEDSHPTWSPKGDRILFDSEFYRWGASAAQLQWTIWINNTDEKGIEPASVQVGGRVINGRSPVWLANDWIVFTGCNYWESGGGNCGLYTAPSWGAETARRLTSGSEDIAADSAGDRILYSSPTDGNWDVYVMNFDGSGRQNLSASPGNDGLPTFSPDGAHIAFLSDRSGAWAVWLMNADGSNQSKLFDLPGALGPDWTGERISWGP